MNSITDLREKILSRGCYSHSENLQIYEKWYAQGTRYLFKAVDKKYSITKKVLCDAGCSYGVNLFYCAPESYGIDIDKYKIDFARSIGLNVYQRDLESDDLFDLPKVEAVWCSAVLEHVLSPHRFLNSLNLLLKPNGLIFIYVPVIPSLQFLEHIPKLKKYLAGYRGQSHVNAFVPETLRFVCEQAGFRTIEISPFYPGLLRWFNPVPFFNRLTGRCVYIGRKNV